MILICDSGSSSSDWAHLRLDQPTEMIRLEGYNPVFHDPARFSRVLEELAGKVPAEDITEIRYYGTGVAGTPARQLIEKQLRFFFPGAEIHIASDLMAAALVTCGDESGIVTILGTGSNACLYDGIRLASHTPSLGYILGDEGSGCDIGKILCRDYYYHRMPRALQASMAELLPATKSGFLEKLNKHPAPNRYLAGFGKVAARFRDHPYIGEIIRERFRLFFDCHVRPYDNDLPLHAVGSVAFGFREIFNTIAGEFGYHTGNIIKQPITGLIDQALNKKQNGR